MTKLICTVLLLIGSSLAAGAETFEKSQGYEPMLRQTDIVLLSKIRHSLHNIANIEEQCSIFLKRVNDNLNPAGPEQVDTVPMLKSISHELRVRQWPYGNVALADYFDLCLEKGKNVKFNVEVLQTSPTGTTTTTTKSSSTGANSKVRIVNGQVVENSVDSLPRSGPAPAVATAIATSGPSGQTAAASQSSYSGSTASQANAFKQQPSSYQPPAEPVSYKNPAMQSSYQSPVVSTSHQQVSAPEEVKLQPTLGPNTGNYQQVSPPVTPASVSAEPTVVDTMSQLVAENEALKRRLEQVDLELRELNDIKEQLSLAGANRDMRSWASDYLSCKKAAEELSVARLQPSMEEVSSADLFKCQEDLEDVRALSDNLHVELDGAKDQLEVCSTQLSNLQLLTGGNSKSKQEIAKLEALLKKQQLDKLQCRKEHTAAIQAKVKSDLEHSKCLGEIAELQTKLASTDYELKRDNNYLSSQNDDDSIEVNYLGDTYTNDDVMDDDMKVGSSNTNSVPIHRVQGKPDINGRKSNAPAAYATATASTGFLGGNDWRAQQAAQIARLHQSRQQYYPTPPTSGSVHFHW